MGIGRSWRCHHRYRSQAGGHLLTEHSVFKFIELKEVQEAHLREVYLGGPVQSASAIGLGGYDSKPTYQIYPFPER